MKRFSFVIVCVLGLIYRCLYSLQGVDNVDVGFCNTFYDVIFDYPESNAFNFIYYLTGLIGGTWEHYLGQYGLVGFRFFDIAILFAALMILYRLFSSSVSSNLLNYALAVSITFPTIFITFHYNTLSFLLISIAAFFFFKWAKNDKLSLLVVSGLFIGLSFAARIVNLSLITLSIIPFFMGKRNGNTRNGIKAALCFFYGIITGLAIILVIMLTLGHTSYYLQALSEAFGFFNSTEATHSRGELIVRYANSLKNVILQMVILSVWIWGYMSASRMKNGGKYPRILLLLVLIVIGYTSLPYLTALSLCLISIIYYFIKGKDKHIENVGIVSFLTLTTLLYPIGSDIGLPGIFHWCAGLLVFPAIFAVSRNKKLLSPKDIAALCICIIISGIAKTTINVYGAKGTRMDCTTRINDSRINVFTDYEKAEMYSHSINVINNCKSNNYMVLGNQFSELYFATKTLPFLGHTQTVIYQGKALEKRLDNKLAQFGEYPLVVFINGSKPYDYEVRNKVILQKWMRKHGYKLASNDKYITIFKHPDSH